MGPNDVAWPKQLASVVRRSRHTSTMERASVQPSAVSSQPAYRDHP